MAQVFSLENRKWDYAARGYWLGGCLPVPNLSKGYHGIMKQWWEHYMKGKQVLLISESKAVKNVFQDHYPHWVFDTLDLFPEESNATQADCDILGDIAHENNPLQLDHYDLIINQATLEHVYNPFAAMKNMITALCALGAFW